ncbi:MAG: phosphoribosyltransferase family protein [Bacteroidota bacterium]
MISAQYLKDFVELFYPKSCASCNAGLNSSEQAICLACKVNFDRLDICDKPGNEVEKRFWGKVRIEGATSYARYVKNGLLQKAIYDLKYQGNRKAGIELGMDLGYLLKKSNRFNNFDLIIPVPLHSRKKKKRGFNQCDFLAEGLSNVLRTEWSDQHLFRIKYNMSQTGKSTFLRNRNTDGIFQANNARDLQKKKVLVIDDVITTGATLEACVKAFEMIKGIRIFVATIASA